MEERLDNMEIKTNINMFQLAFYAFLLLCLGSCYKDKGNYDINMPITPEIIGLDTLYEAVVGDSLIIEPRFAGVDASQLELQWRVMAPESVNPERDLYEGHSLRMVFGYGAKVYTTQLTVTNKANGMKYFHNFKIRGITEFSKGNVVLSIEDGVTKLSFVKPDNTVQPNIYTAINGENLPSDPLHLYFMRHAEITNAIPLGYWIITKNGGVRIAVDDLTLEKEKPNTLSKNFFLAPETIDVGSLQNHRNGVLMGVINGKFYGGTTQTWDQAHTYGMFGNYADGNYELAPQFIMSTVNGNTIMIAYEKDKKQFLRINFYGVPVYFGTQYTTINTEIFDPQNVGMDLLHIVQINNADTYAYMKDETGNIYELKFTVNFNGPFTFTSEHKRLFIRQEWINADTKMVATQNGNIYIATQNKVYRYNPINQQVREMEATFTDKVTMLKLEDDENTLIVGSGNSIYYLNIQTGRNGDLTGQIDGIPGAPVDMAWRK
ncbi:hypothetical protein FAZ15_02795 [Sphingobacterium olei]|uniref:PKD family protein n=1 Tax=Sphingobacterium olei TaxID=2571155 RepID=A0A4U0P6X6_9SPHI|nr:PKD-like family lipoprotein [Sphingobacterium olei]TJZ63236.1 hypothetical protein FAZ15_02795 [Sphingobacterium olei]